MKSLRPGKPSHYRERRRKAKILEKEEHWLDVLGAAESRTWKERYYRGVNVLETQQELTSTQQLQEMRMKMDTTLKMLDTERADHRTTQ